MTGYNGTVTVRDRRDIMAILRRAAEKEGQLVGAYARQLIRRGLRDRDDLTKQERQLLGIALGEEQRREYTTRAG